MKLEKLDVIISADDFTTLKNTAELNEKYIDSISFELKDYFDSEIRKQQSFVKSEIDIMGTKMKFLQKYIDYISILNNINVDIIEEKKQEIEKLKSKWWKLW